MAATSATTIQEIMFDIGIWDRHKAITCLRRFLGEERTELKGLAAFKHPKVYPPRLMTATKRQELDTCLRQGTMATALQLEAQGCTDYKLIARLKEYRAWDHESLAKCIGVSGATLRYYCKRHRVRINAPCL